MYRLPLRQTKRSVMGKGWPVNVLVRGHISSWFVHINTLFLGHAPSGARVANCRPDHISMQPNEESGIPYPGDHRYT